MFKDKTFWGKNFTFIIIIIIIYLCLTSKSHWGQISLLQGRRSQPYKAIPGLGTAFPTRATDQYWSVNLLVPGCRERINNYITLFHLFSETEQCLILENYLILFVTSGYGSLLKNIYYHITVSMPVISLSFVVFISHAIKPFSRDKLGCGTIRTNQKTGPLFPTVATQWLAQT